MTPVFKILTLAVLCCVLSCNLQQQKYIDKIEYLSEIEKVCSLLYYENDTFNYNFQNIALYGIDSLSSANKVFSFYPEKHEILLKEEYKNVLKNNFAHVGNIEVAVYQDATVLFILSRKGGYINSTTSAMASERSVNKFEEFGHKLENKKEIFSDWYYFDWSIGN
jgi:hypothetical protein